MTRAARMPLLGAAVGLMALVLALRPGGPVVPLVVDLGTVAAAAAATVAAVWRARRLTGRGRRSWSLMAAAFGAALTGEVLWAFYELVLGRETPFPSPADIAYLCFPVLALLALLRHPATRVGGLRAVLDGLLVSASLLQVSWATSLGATYASGEASDLAFGVALAYPLSDVVLLTAVLVVLTSSPARSGLALLAGGLAAQALADSAYGWASTNGTYATGHPLDLFYVIGYLLMMEAALADQPSEAVPVDREPSWTGTLLPYVPAAIAIVVATSSLPADLSDPVISLGLIIVVVLFARQLVSLVDNRRLVGRLLQAQQRLSHQAFHDALTGLANRALFADRAAHAVAQHRRSLRPAAVLLLDLDDFKSVNDGLGHDTGDELLVRVAERLRAATRSSDTVARLGGDEFAVLLEGDDDPYGLAQRVLEALDQPVLLAGRELPVHASIGVALLSVGDVPVDPAELLKRADVAMYAAKQAGKGAIATYEPGMTDASQELDLRAELVAAVTEDLLDVHYQPLFTPRGELLGFEALSRWTRHGELVPPDRFIAAAERAGILRALDEQVLRRALAFATRGVGQDHQVFVTVNAGMQHLTDPDLPEQLARLLAAHGLEPSRLVVEVPEHQAYRDLTEAAVTLQRLRRLGVRLALDDFGVGYSSLLRLQELPPDIVKIDRCFIAPLAAPDADTAVLAGMIDLAHRTGALVVAEGVEQPQQLAVLTELGCDAVQGYLLGRPVSAEEAARVPRLPRPRAGARR